MHTKDYMDSVDIFVALHIYYNKLQRTSYEHAEPTESKSIKKRL